MIDRTQQFLANLKHAVRNRDSAIVGGGVFHADELKAISTDLYRAFEAHADLVAALELIHANAAESPEWIRERTSVALAKAKGGQ